MIKSNISSVCLALILSLSMALPAQAQLANEPPPNEYVTTTATADIGQNYADALAQINASRPIAREFTGFVLPEAKPKKAETSIIKTYLVDATAYTSSPEECKPTDYYTTADGSHTRDGIIAANFLPFNTLVRIPELFGDKLFEVHDRMNARYWYRIDVWMEKKADMREFGIHHKVKLEIIKLGDNHTAWHLADAKKP